MPREKVFVQSHEGGAADLARILDARSDIALARDVSGDLRRAMVRRTDSFGAATEPDPELAEYIVDHLRTAYDELLNEPVPDHLIELLAHLCDAEDKS
jgi:hypothetical protein